MDEILASARLLENTRCQLSESDASYIHFASTLLTHPNGLPSTATNKNGGNAALEEGELNSNMFVSPGVKDAWLALCQNSTLDDTTANSNATATANNTTANNEEEGGVEYPPLPKGQLSKATKIHALETSLLRASHVASQLHSVSKSRNDNSAVQKRKHDDDKNNNNIPNPANDDDKEKNLEEERNVTQSQIKMMQTIQTEMKEASSNTNSNSSSNAATPNWYMHAFQKRVRDIRDYHAKHNQSQPNTNNKSTSTSTTALSDSANQLLLDYSLDQMTIIGDSKTRFQPDYNTTDPTQTTTNGGANTTMQSIIEQQRKTRRIANPSADGYDLYSIFNVNLSKIKSGDVYTMEEVLGKYLDLMDVHDYILSVPTLNNMFAQAVHATWKHKKFTSRKRGNE